MSNSNNPTEIVNAGFGHSQLHGTVLTEMSACERGGLLAAPIILMSKAFFHKCGYRETSTIAAETAQKEHPEKQFSTGSRSECVQRSIKRLHDEAEIALPELREFLRWELIATPKAFRSQNPYRNAFLSIHVDLLAKIFKLLFRASPNERAEAVCRKVFVWLCGKSWEQAITDEDKRFIKQEGVDMVKSGVLKSMQGIDTLFRELFEESEEEDE